MSDLVARRPVRLLTLSAIAILFACALSAPAQSQVPERWAQLARQADLVALGECASERAAWSDENFITTTVQFQLHRVFKGDMARSVTVKTLGGRVGDDSMSASHGATLAAGEQVLLFLKQSEFGSYYVIVGGEDGKLVVDEVPPAWRGAPSPGTRAELARLLNGEVVE